MESLRQQQIQQQIPDLEAVRDRILSSLKLGRQAAGYRAAAKALDQFIATMRSSAELD